MVKKFSTNQILLGYWNIFHRLRGQEELDRANFRLKSTDTDDVRSRKSSTGNFLTRRLKDIQFVFHNPTSGPFIWVQYPTMYGAIALPPGGFGLWIMYWKACLHVLPPSPSLSPSNLHYANGNGLFDSAEWVQNPFCPSNGPSPLTKW